MVRLETLKKGARFLIPGLPGWGEGIVLRTNPCRVYVRFRDRSEPRSFVTKTGETVTIPARRYVERDVAPGCEVEPVCLREKRGKAA